MTDVSIRELFEDTLGLDFLKEASSYSGSGELVFECPFCADGKGDHFYVSADEGLWKCHKCGESGNARSLVRKLLDLGAIDDDIRNEALRQIGSDGKDRRSKMREMFKSKLVRKEPPPLPPPIQKIWAETVRFCHEYLPRKARAELRERLSDKAIDWFQLGVSHRRLPDHLIGECGFDRELCIEAGVLVERKGELVARWRGAFIIPTFENGEVVGLDYRLRNPELVVKYGRYRALTGYPRQLFNVDAAR